MDTLLVSIDESAEQIPNLSLSQKIFRFEQSCKCKTANETVDSIKSEILKDIEAADMAPLYEPTSASK